MPEPVRATTPAVGFDFACRLAPAMATRSMPFSFACRKIGAVSVPTCKLLAIRAPGMLGPTGMRCSVTSSPRLAKKPLSLATNAGTNVLAPV
jgi:hypothetical protein